MMGHSFNVDRCVWQTAPAPRDALLMCLVVPVRNEGTAVASTLASIAAQRTLAGTAFDLDTVEVLVLANNCTDNSAAIARAFAATHASLAVHVAELELPPALAHIGHVRRLLMDAACHRLESDGLGGLIISTDGDTVVDPQWLARTVQAFEAGADVVGGRILLDSHSGMDAATLRHQRCDTAHQLARSRLEDVLDPDPADPWPRHHQHFCASLALRSQAYRLVGGIPDVRFLEDVALVDACRLADLRVRHSPLVRVHTSPRQDGRAEVGLSWQLRQWSEARADPQQMQVEDPDVFVARIKRRRLLREAWQRAHPAGDPDAAMKAALNFENAAGGDDQPHIAQTFGAFWQRAQQASSKYQQKRAVPKVNIRHGIDRLHTLIERYSADAPASCAAPDLPPEEEREAARGQIVTWR